MERLGNGADLRLALRCRAVMQRERSALILEQEAGSTRSERRQLWPQRVERRHAGGVVQAIDPPVGAAAFQPVQAGCGALPRMEQPVELGEGTTADQREGCFAFYRQAGEQ